MHTVETGIEPETSWSVEDQAKWSDSYLINLYINMQNRSNGRESCKIRNMVGNHN